MSAFLFSVDVEDPRLHAGGAPDPRVPATVDLWLDFLRRQDARATFFVVGEAARAHRGLVARIAGEGHEIAAHSQAHVPLDRLGKAGFRDDLRRNRDSLAEAGARDLEGYRAPCFSLTRATSWAWEILAGEGFAWSSSVLPARSPLYGWPGYGAAPRLVHGVVEMPVTLHPWLPVPAAGGVYFRILPAPLLRLGLSRLKRRGGPVLAYFHPYDIDEEPQLHAFPGHRRGGLADRLLRANRKAVLPRLETLLGAGLTVGRYGEEARRLRAALLAPPPPNPAMTAP